MFAEPSPIVETLRDLQAVIAPATGERSVGLVRVRRDDSVSSDVKIPTWRTLFPVVERNLRTDLPFRFAPPEATRAVFHQQLAEPRTSDSAHTLASDATSILVPVYSLVGGKRFGAAMKPGTTFRLEYTIPGIAPTVELVEVWDEGADPDWFGAVRSTTEFEQLGAGTATLDAFRSQMGALPGVLFVWESSEPADGITDTPLSRGATRVGRGRQLFAESFTAYVITKRMDSDPKRRAEGLQVLDEITGWLSDAQMADGRPFSVPTGIQIVGRERLALDSEDYQQLYVYTLSFDVTRTVCRRPDPRRVFAPLRLIHHQHFTYEKDVADERRNVVDQLIEIPQDE